MTNATNKPIEKLKLGAINAAIWKTDTENGPVFNVTFDRVYRNGEGNFGNTNSFRSRDLLVLAKLADLAHTAVTGDLAIEDADSNAG